MIAVLALVCTAAAPATRPATAPVGSRENPRQITSADVGPDIDPVKLAASPYSGIPLFRTFGSFMSSSYATAQVWVYAEKDDPAIYRMPVTYSYPDFYRPTWGEVFDHLARQTRTSWSWNPVNRQFKFERMSGDPFFSVTLAEGWRREDRGIHIWHAPKDQPFGLDVYYFGHFTADKDTPDLFKKVRSHFAARMLSNWPDAPPESRMSTVKVGGVDALHLTADTPRPGGVWRQWSFVADGHAFVIVSAMPKDRQDQLLPAVEGMVGSFKLQSPATRPATRPAR
jgi:hypothetical protein